MSVILVNGSTHAKGCTFTSLKEVEKTLNESGIKTDIFQYQDALDAINVLKPESVKNIKMTKSINFSDSYIKIIMMDLYLDHQSIMHQPQDR